MNDLDGAQIASALNEFSFAESAEMYLFKGDLTAAAQVGTSPQNGQWPVEDLPANPDQHWKFTISFGGDGFESVTDPWGGNRVVVRNTQLILNPVDVGLHITAPHERENPNNQLPTLSSGTTNMTDGTIGYSIGPQANQEHFNWTDSVFAWGSVTHGRHRDYYGFSSPFSMFTNGGTTTLEATSLQVFAAHTTETYFTDEDVRKLRKKIGTALAVTSAGTADDPLLIFDAGTGTLSFTPGRVNVLDRQGGESGSLSPEFAGDALAHAALEISPLAVAIGEDGQFRLSGGSVVVADEDSQAHFSASFDEGLIGANNPHGLENFAILDQGSGGSIPGDTPSFLSQFVEEHVVPADLATADAHPLGLSFRTPEPLLEATLGFTQSIVMPVEILIGGVTVPPELSADFNNDGVVDGVDFLLWQTNFGAEAPTAGDADHDGDVDGSDFLLWQQQFGSTAGHGGEERHGVPEPSSILLAGLLAALSPHGHRRS